MSKIILVVIYKSIPDEDKVAKYAAPAGPAMEAAGARILARGMPAVVKEAGEAARTVVIEWGSLDTAEKVYDSEVYQAAVAALDDAAVREIRYFETV